MDPTNDTTGSYGMAARCRGVAEQPAPAQVRRKPSVATHRGMDSAGGRGGPNALTDKLSRPCVHGALWPSPSRRRSNTLSSLSGGFLGSTPLRTQPWGSCSPGFLSEPEASATAFPSLTLPARIGGLWIQTLERSRVSCSERAAGLFPAERPHGGDQPRRSLHQPRK